MKEILILVAWMFGILIAVWASNVLHNLIEIRKELTEIRENLAKMVDDNTQTW